MIRVWHLPGYLGSPSVSQTWGIVMAVDGFLKLDGIKGESRDDMHPDEIHILDLHFSKQYGGGGTGKLDFHDISLTKRFDLSSPALMALCANGKHIKEGPATFRKGGDHPLGHELIRGIPGSAEG